LNVQQAPGIAITLGRRVGIKRKHLTTRRRTAPVRGDLHCLAVLAPLIGANEDG
jgi:hypothetical protein